MTASGTSTVVPDLPPAPALPTGQAPGYARTCRLNGTDWARLKTWAGAAGLTPAVLLTAAFAEVLRTWSSTDGFTIGQLVVERADGTFAERARQHADLGLPVVVDGIDLEFRAFEAGGALHWEWRVRDQVLPEGVALDMADAFDRLLRLLAQDEKNLFEEHFPLVPDYQLAQRAEINATAAEVPDRLLHTAIAEHARVRPDAAAVITSTRLLTYSQLSRRVNQVGRRLRDLGVRPNQLVAVVMDKGWEQVVAVHGVLAAGAAYLPIDATVPAERLHFLLAHGEVGIVLTQASLDSALDWPSGVRRLSVDEDFDGVDDGELEPVQRPTDLAYVIFTSGSTGVPKGVMVDHRGALNTILDINGRFGIGPDDRCIAVSGLHFDLSVYDMFGMIVAGGAVVLPDPAVKPDPGHWSALVEQARVTFWNSVPALLEMLVMYTELTRRSRRLASLRLVILAGDWIPVTLPQRLRALNEHVRVIASGGPAETCVWSVIYPIGTVDPSWTSIPYGRPMTNQQYHVLDKRMRPCPVWVPGEIHIASEAGLAQGYWRDEERTGKQFRTIPGTGQRAYASGDMGRYLPDGNIEILGREDFQVKIQGVRIELGEIEAALTAHPSVRSAVVVAAGKVRDLPVLHGYVVWEDGEPTGGIAELRAFLGRKLPASMVPPVLTALDRLPLTRNGKVDRLGLAHSCHDNALKPAGS